MKIVVEAKPNSKKTEIQHLEGNRYRVKVHAPAREGKANRAVLELLSTHFGVPKSRITLLSGEGGRIKVFDIPSDGPGV
jgi:uncharacterized protein (TIGR00251 family)